MSAINAVEKGAATLGAHLVRDVSLPALVLHRDALEHNIRWMQDFVSNSGAQRRDLSDLAGFLDIQLSDKNLKDFYIITYYDNGQRDKVWYRREAIVEGGQFYLELSKAKEFAGANLLSVFLEPTKASAAPTDVETRLCL